MAKVRENADDVIELSISFDRAADYYDATRALPASVQKRLIDRIQAELSRVPTDRVLEVGVGTGRLARPLSERGIKVCGVDIAPRMLAKLQEQEEEYATPDLILGDATRLPIASDSFSAALIALLLHLVPQWEQALGEVRRVLIKEGVLIHYSHRGEWGAWSDGGKKWDELLGSRRHVRRPRPGSDEIREKLQALGGQCRVVTVAEDEESRTLAEVVQQTRERIHSWTWEIPDDVFADCLNEYEAWALEFYGGLQHRRVDKVYHELDVWSFD